MINSNSVQTIDEALNELAEKNYSVMDSFFSAELCTALRQNLEYDQIRGNMQKAGIGQGQDFQIVPSIRGDWTRWLSATGENPAERAFLQQMAEIQKKLNQNFFIGLQSLEAHYAFYPPGNGYQKHFDQHAQSSPQARARKVTFILYLNENWQPTDGGELLLFDPGDDDQILRTIDPLGGRFVLFRSEVFPHAVANCLSPRKSLTGWYRTDSE